MRVDHYESRGESRDSLDQRWFPLLYACGLSPLPIPNNLQSVASILEQNSVQGIILTGGNTPSCLGDGDAPERDEVEKSLIQRALSNNVPLLGVCRGMQMLQLFFGSTLEIVEGHIAKNHVIEGTLGRREVNSFHKYGCKDANNPHLDVLAYTTDGVIEAIAHKTKKIKGIMWHPERTSPFDSQDISFIRDLFYD